MDLSWSCWGVFCGAAVWMVLGSSWAAGTGDSVSRVVAGSCGCRGPTPMSGAQSSLSCAVPLQTEWCRLQLEMVQLLPVGRMLALRPR